MSIIPASHLFDSDLALLGNNIRPAKRRPQSSSDSRANRRIIAAVNRSLSRIGERIDVQPRQSLALAS